LFLNQHGLSDWIREIAIAGTACWMKPARYKNLPDSDRPSHGKAITARTPFVGAMAILQQLRRNIASELPTIQELSQRIDEIRDGYFMYFQASINHSSQDNGRVALHVFFTLQAENCSHTQGPEQFDILFEPQIGAYKNGRKHAVAVQSCNHTEAEAKPDSHCWCNAIFRHLRVPLNLKGEVPILSCRVFQSVADPQSSRPACWFLRKSFQFWLLA
jgi:hypothetical protein